MHFEFNQQLMPQSEIEIEEIGQFGLEAWNDEGYYWYAVVRTCLGTTTFATCGPVIPDINLLPSGFISVINKMPYKEEKINKAISFFLNDRSKGLTNAKIISIEDAINQFRDVKTYLLNFSEETF